MAELKQKLLVSALILLVIVFGGVLYLKFVTQPTSKIKLAQDFPNIPQYPGAVLIKSNTDPHEGETYNGVKYSATWQVKVKLSDVSKWYMTKLPSSGWTVDVPPGNINAEDIQLITFINDTYTLNMSFSKNSDSGLTSITSEFSLKFSDTKEPGEEEGE
jgi:hypothetical protein